MELKTQSIVIMRGEVDPQTASMMGMKTLFVGFCSSGSVKHIQTNWFVFKRYDFFFKGVYCSMRFENGASGHVD